MNKSNYSKRLGFLVFCLAFTLTMCGAAAAAPVNNTYNTFQSTITNNSILLNNTTTTQKSTEVLPDPQIWRNGTDVGNYTYLVNAITAAKPGDTIMLENSSIFTPIGPGFTISKNLTFNVLNNGTAIITGADTNSTGHIFTIDHGITVNMINIIFIDAKNGAIVNNGTLNIKNCKFTNNHATDDGGAIKNEGILNLNNTTFKNNTAVNGGAIYNDGTCIVNGSNIIDNNATVVAGGIRNNGNCTVTNSSINSNTAQYGAGISNAGNCNFTVTNSSINNNTANTSGGAINYGALKVTNSNFTGNTAKNGPGGSINNYGTLKVTSSNFINNKATYGGGAIYNHGIAIVNFNRIVGNSAGTNPITKNTITNYGTINATDNWWGSNNPNFTNLISGNVNTTPWIVLTLTTNPNIITNNGSSIITANLQYDSNGTVHAPAKGHIPDGIPVTFNTTLGNIGNLSSTINGIAQSTLKSGTVSGIATVSIALDNQTIKTPVTINISSLNIQRMITGYFPTWSDSWYATAGMTEAQIIAASTLAQEYNTAYTNIMLAFGQPNFSWSGLQNNTWAGTGLDFCSAPQDVNQAIIILHNAGKKVLLSVGGEGVTNWDALAAEANITAGPNTPIRNSLTSILVDLKLDGLDVDYEVGITDNANIARYADVVQAMREAVDSAEAIDHIPRQLTLAAWSIGADYTAQISNPKNSSQISYWGDPAGGERLLLKTVLTSGAYKGIQVMNLLDAVNIMTYCAGYQYFDPTVSYDQYRQILPSNIVLSMGFCVPPEDWGGAILAVKNVDAYETGTMVLMDQYQRPVNQPYSVERSVMHILANKINYNPQDGIMIWDTLDTNNIMLVTSSGASVPAAVPATILKEALSIFNGPAPNITSTNPANGAVNVLNNTNINITFSEPIKIGNDNIILTTSSSGTAVPFTTSINGDVLTITPSNLLTNDTKYFLTLHTGSITDLAGNPLASWGSSFSVGPAPTVLGVYPVNGAVNVLNNTNINITFSEPIKIGNDNMILTTSSSGAAIPFTTSITNDVLTITPTNPLTNDTKYYLTLHTGSVTDLAGNPLASWGSSFTTTKT
jgi:predicted outer membrane repeat protein